MYIYAFISKTKGKQYVYNIYMYLFKNLNSSRIKKAINAAWATYKSGKYIFNQFIPNQNLL